MCSICENPIIPRDGKDAFKIECMGRNFHENCYRCEVSGAGEVRRAVAVGSLPLLIALSRGQEKWR